MILQLWPGEMNLETQEITLNERITTTTIACMIDLALLRY